jgi:hypothetical protein
VPRTIVNVAGHRQRFKTGVMIHAVITHRCDYPSVASLILSKSGTREG